MRKISTPFVLTVLCTWLLLEAPVEAYLDAGSGSMLLQIILGGFAAFGVIAKLYWHRVTAVFRSKDSPAAKR